MRKVFFILAFMIFMSGQPAWADDTHESIVISDPWVRLQPPIRPNSAAFMTIENKSQAEVVLKSVTSPSVETVELHSMERVDGVMKMRLTDAIKIPAQGRVELKPGGLHLMLFGIQKPLVKGEVIELNLRFEDGTERMIQALVQDPEGVMVTHGSHEMKE